MHAREERTALEAHKKAKAHHISAPSPFSCASKDGSFFPRVHEPLLRTQHTASAERPQASSAPARAGIPMSLAPSLLIIFLQSLPIESGKTPDSMTAAFQIISRVELP